MRDPIQDYRVTWERVVPEERSHWRVLVEHLARYHAAGRVVAGKRVLDSGTGTGYGAAMLASAGASTVVGIDVADDAIAYARATRRAPNLEFTRMDGRDLAFPPGSFDVVTSFEVIEHLKDPDRYLDEIRRVLAPSGVFILSTPNRASWRPSFFEHVFQSSPYHETEFSLGELLDLLRPRFRQVAALGQNNVPAAALDLADDQASERLVYANLGQLLVRSRLSPDRPPVVEDVGRFAARPAAELAAYHFVICGDQPLPEALLDPPVSPTYPTPSDAVLYAFNMYRLNTIVEERDAAMSQMQAQVDSALRSVQEKDEYITYVQERYDEASRDLAAVKQYLGELEKQVVERESEIARKDEFLSAVSAQFRQKEIELREKDQHLQAIEDRARELERELARKDGYLAEVSAAFSRTQLELGQKDEYIGQLEATVGEREEEDRRKAAYIEKLGQEFEAKCAIVERLEREAREVQAELRQKDEFITALQQQVSRLERQLREGGLVIPGATGWRIEPADSAAGESR